MIKDFQKTAIVTQKGEISYSEMLKLIDIYAHHTPRQKGAKTLIFGENREGWIYAFFSVWRNEGVAVPVDAGSTASDVAYILRDCQPECMWTTRQCEDVARQAIAETGAQTEVLIIDEYEANGTNGSNETNRTNKTNETNEDNNSGGLRPCMDRGDEMALIIYTSGTTGSPKGVMLSFTNLKANDYSVSEDVPIFNSERRAIILLPLHHVLPLMGTLIIPIIRGGGVAISPSMAAADIMDTLCRGKVGIFVGVPRLWQTLYAGIKKKIDGSFVTRALFKLCQKVGSRTLSRIVFASVKKKMGGHLDYCVSGGAALDKEIGEGLKVLGLDVLEGYGMTECAPMISFTRPGDIIPGCAGRPLKMVECKLVDGELCARGENVMLGYYNRPEETAAVIDQDGFIHTGDLARFDDEGRVYITGRTKEIIVLSNGKNVQPAEIEYKLEKYADRVKEAAVVQDGDMLRAIIVPQDLWARDLSDETVTEQLKRDVIELYNKTVSNYKKLMSLAIYREPLPRTKLDKLQRFKLKAILENIQKGGNKTENDEPIVVPTTPEYKLLSDYIEGVKKLTPRPTDHLETDLAFDSLDKIEMQGFIEQTFGLTMTIEDLTAFHNLQALSEHIAHDKTRMEVTNVDWHQLLDEHKDSLKLNRTSLLMPLHFKYLKLLHLVYNRVSISGLENIPAKGPFIVAPNHQSFLDGPLAVCGMPWSRLYNTFFYVTEEHVKGIILRKMAKRNNMILMERRDLKNSILRLAEVLRQGKNIVIFPEGTRSHDGQLDSFKKTFAILAKELQCPILPVCIDGAYDAMPRGTHFLKPGKITVQYLEPIQPTDDDTYDTLCDRTRRAIQTQLNK